MKLLLFVLIGYAISIALGIWIARTKHRPAWQGVVAGIFGLIGLIVLAVLPARGTAPTANAV